MLSAVIFIKHLGDAKSRLDSVLSPLERAALATRLLLNVVDAAKGAPRVREVIVVSPDPGIAAILGRDDVRVLQEPHPDGLSAAILFASTALVASGEVRALLLPADLPCIAAEHIEALIDAHARSGTDIIVPSNDRAGTNALLIELPPRFPLAFGPDSFNRHLVNAARCGRRLDLHQCQHIGADIDVPNDLRHLSCNLVS